MADFCKQCSIEEFGEDFEELKGLCESGTVFTMCEGCGACHVNKDGECVSPKCMKKHGEKANGKG